MVSWVWEIPRTRTSQPTSMRCGASESVRLPVDRGTLSSCRPRARSIPGEEEVRLVFNFYLSRGIFRSLLKEPTTSNNCFVSKMTVA